MSKITGPQMYSKDWVDELFDEFSAELEWLNTLESSDTGEKYEVPGEWHLYYDHKGIKYGYQTILEDPGRDNQEMARKMSGIYLYLFKCGMTENDAGACIKGFELENEKKKNPIKRENGEFLVPGFPNGLYRIKDGRAKKYE